MVLALLITTFMTAVPFGTGFADVLLIEEVRQSDRMELPDNGLSKDDVKAHFGEPVNIHGAVGDPPITRWDYSGWSVYFEYGLVLFTVLHKGQVLDKNREQGG
jgi:hypothetical protein